MQQSRRPGQKQPAPSPEEIASMCLQIRAGWTLDERVRAITDATVARQQPDWDPAWDAELQRDDDDR